MTINELYHRHGKFVARKFPQITDFRGPLHHLKKEADEAIESGEADEFADILLLLFSAYRLRFPDGDPDKLVEVAAGKLARLENREWGSVNEQGFQEHIS